MRETALAIQAIAAMLARRYYYIALFFGIAISLLLAVGIWLLANYVSVWFWLLSIPFYIVFGTGLLVYFAVGRILRRFTKILSTEQKQAAAEFSYKVQGLAEVAGTPKFLFLFRVLRDFFRPKKSGYLKGLFDNSSSLSSDFQALRRLFR